MTIEHYSDFVILAEDVSFTKSGLPKTFSVRVFDSPIGQGEKKETVSIPDDMPMRIRQMEERVHDQNLPAQIEFGELLAALLLPEYARKLLSICLARLKTSEGLRLRLRMADELADIPWEYLYIQDTRGEKDASGFLALDPRLSIARHEALAVPGDWFEERPQRRVLVAMASPNGFERLVNLPQEQQSLRKALAGVPAVETVYLPEYQPGQTGELPGATSKDLITQLQQRTDVFHFSGHGEFAATIGAASGGKVGVGGIVLSSAGNQAFVASAGELAEMLKGRGVRLVVLGSCETGRLGGQNIWSGTATALLRAGIPAVVAMQFKIKDTLASEFMGAFYRALVAGLAIDEAMVLGRITLRTAASAAGTKDVRDWGVPLLYLRSPSGVVFHPVSDEVALQQTKQSIDQLIQQEAAEVTSEGRIIGPVVDGLTSGQIEVEQTVPGAQAGVMIGGLFYGVSGGRLVIKQKVGVLSGTMVAGRFGTRTVQPPSEEELVRQIEDLLKLKAE